MDNTEERLRQPVSDNFRIKARTDGDPLQADYSLRALGATSVDFVAFAKPVVDDFVVVLSPADRAKYCTFGEPVGRQENRPAITTDQ